MRPNLDPSDRELRWFGVMALVFFAIVGLLIYHRSESAVSGLAALVFGSLLALIYYLFPRTQRPIYRTWMIAVWPIGWLVSHLLLALVYYLVVTPVGVAIRMLGHDPLRRKFDPEAETYWEDCPSDDKPESYFRQF